MLHRSIDFAPPAWRRGAAACLLALLLGAAAPGAQAAPPLGLDEALRLAQERSRQLLAHDAAALAARHAAVAAGQRPDPVLRAGIDNLPVSGADRFHPTRDFMTMRSVGVMQELTRGAKLQARAARFEREADIAAASRDRADANLQRDTAAAWLDRHYAERVRDVLLRQRDEARLQIDAADAAHRGGRGAQADAFAARSAVALIDDRIAAADQQVAVAITQLARWVGPPATAPLAAPPGLTSVRFRPGDLEHRLGEHPDIVLLTRREARAQAEVDLAQADKKSDVTVELMYSQRGSAYSNMVSLNVSVPLRWDQGRRQDREVASRLALLEQVRAEREEATRMLVAETLALWQQWQGNRERLARYDSTLLPLAGEGVRAALAAYRGASGTLAAVLEARRRDIDTQLERLRLEMDTARLWAQLNYLFAAGQGVVAPAR